MRLTTGLTLLAIGAILCFAVSVHPWFISPQIVGLVLMLTGGAGLCLRQCGTGWFQRQLAAIRQLLAEETESLGRRVPLDDLLTSPAAETGLGRPAGQAGSQARSAQ